MKKVYIQPKIAEHNLQTDKLMVFAPLSGKANPQGGAPKNRHVF
jgi:hypothetical protein